MLSSVLASFAPLVLLALPVTAAPRNALVIPVSPPKNPGDYGTGVTPRVTPNITLFIDHQLNFTAAWNIYDENAKVAYTTSPVGERKLAVVPVDAPKEVKYMDLGREDCMSVLSRTLYLDEKASGNRWTVEDDTHKPDTFSPVFVHPGNDLPTGDVHLGPYSNYVLASILKKAVPPPTLQESAYYSIFLPADSGHDNYISGTDAIILLLTIVQAQGKCATKIGN